MTARLRIGVLALSAAGLVGGRTTPEWAGGGTVRTVQIPSATASSPNGPSSRRASRSRSS